MAEVTSTEVIRRPRKFIGVPPIVSRRDHGEQAVIEGGARVFDRWRFFVGVASDVEEDLLMAGRPVDMKPIWRRHGSSPAKLERENG